MGIHAVSMAITDYQAKYIAYELTRQAPSDSLDKLAAAVSGAQVDLNPHQVDAALFAFKSPLSKGALLADEVGLGKTIEAGLVLSQHWAELRRRLLVICPSSLRKQWHQELSDKFFLPARILEKKPYDAIMEQEFRNPFDGGDGVVICSIEFAHKKASAIRAVKWDLVVIDEAHRLRNVWKPDNKIASAIHRATEHHKKLLLTATPLQNSLMELYGLTSFIDEHAFGDIESFREQFMGAASNGAYSVLRRRLRPMVTRTLRRQVEGYISYTKRSSITQPFTPDDQEDALYEMVSEYLRRPNLQALPKGTRSLITMTLRKLLASSTFAIAGALTTMSDRLKRELRDEEIALGLVDELAEDDDLFAESDELSEEDAPEPTPRVRDVAAMRAEIAELEAFRELALGIETNAKGDALLSALSVAMDQVAADKAPRKAVIFTESRKTQDYLQRILADTEWKDGIVLFNGQNNDPRSREIYKAWLEEHKGTDRIVDSPASNMRAALVDYFRTDGQIMIATEAAAEGINLQFCSLVINYDLPWNPQRIEQRIGRCHRYGQKHDVVVVNFLNTKNQADQRVYELLKEKFRLFDGIFGSSDDPLGTIESGVDFEKRIFNLYQNCRTPEEIEAEYQQLRMELAPQIDQQMAITNQKLLEHFDDEVREKLRVRDEASRAYLSRFERQLMDVTRHELAAHAEFLDDSAFRLKSSPFGDGIPLGLYEFPRRSGEAHLYRLGHPLAEKVLAQAKSRSLAAAEVAFDYSAYDGRISILEPLLGKSGWLRLSLFTVESLDQAEDHLIFAGVTDDGQPLDEDQLPRLFSLPARTNGSASLPAHGIPQLDTLTTERQSAIQRAVKERNTRFFEIEVDKLEGWADDLKLGLEREIKELDRQIKEARRAATSALNLEEKLAGQKKIKSLEGQRNEKRRTLFDAQDQVDRQREELIAAIEGKLAQRIEHREIFSIRWNISS